MQSGKNNYILIADSHLSNEESAESFFAMLDCISSSLLAVEKEKRSSLVFLGDIFELWIALPGYEEEYHLRFLAWCRKFKEEFPVYFIEGNHEFFVTQKHGKDFTLSSPALIRKKNVIFLHGDGVNLADWKYRSLRILIRNPFTAFLLSLFAGFGGTFIAEKVRKGLKKTNLENKKYFPASYMEKRAEQLLTGEKTVLVAGHFHNTHLLQEKGSPARKICILPAWDKESGLAGILSADGKFMTANWQKLFQQTEKKD